MLRKGLGKVIYETYLLNLHGFFLKLKGLKVLNFLSWEAFFTCSRVFTRIFIPTCWYKKCKWKHEKNVR